MIFAMIYFFSDFIMISNLKRGLETVLSGRE